MARTLCDWSRKDIAAKPDKLARLLHEPRFFCAKCARASSSARALCKARKLPAAAPRHEVPELPPA